MAPYLPPPLSCLQPLLQLLQGGVLPLGGRGEHGTLRGKVGRGFEDDLKALAGGPLVQLLHLHVCRARADGGFRRAAQGGGRPSTHPSQGLRGGLRLLTWDSQDRPLPAGTSLRKAAKRGCTDTTGGGSEVRAAAGHTHPHTGRRCWGAAVSRSRSRGVTAPTAPSSSCRLWA